MFKNAIRIAVFGLAWTLSLGSSAAELNKAQIDIPAGDLSAALNLLVRQSGADLVYRPEQVQGLQTKGVKGNLSAEEAVIRLLDGTALTVNTASTGAMLIAMPASAELLDADRDRTGIKSGSREKVKLVQSDVASPQSSEAPTPKAASKAAARGKVEEVVVTGTHVRGIASSASPLTTYSREDIERTGVGSTEQFLRTLTQNFGGGISGLSSGPIYGGDDSGSNFSLGSGVNLRGLGNDSTLILLDGKRLASSGIGNFVDISMIPLGAIDRIDVLTDGASSIYGSDAVAGVVNVILRKDFDGAETYARYGSVTEGSHRELQAGQVFGKTWDSGSALFSYDYSDATQLDSRDRAVARALLDPADLLPEETKHSAIASVSQALTDRVELSGGVIFSKRDAERDFIFNNVVPEHNDFSAELYGGHLEATVDLTADWQASFGGLYNASTTDTHFIRSGVQSGTFDTRSSIRSLDADADGRLFDTAAGAVRLAIGTHYRRESYDSNGSLVSTLEKAARDVYAGFAEMFIPLVGESNALPGVRALELTLAARYEHYSDFGSTTDPKAGLRWSPAGGLSVRGTYGTSFRAPLLSELDDSFPNIIALPFPPPLGPPVVYVEGNLGTLQAEEARTWTAGLDFEPESLPGFKAELTYFDIVFDERIAAPITPSSVFTALANPVYAPFVTRNPTLPQVNAFYSNPLFRNPFGIQPANITAIVDNRLANTASRDVDGVDFSLSHRWETGSGEFGASLAGTYFLNYADRVTAGTPTVELLNTVFYPVDFRMRNSLSWSRDAFGVTAFWNYTDSYRNTSVTPNREIASWTTFDLDLSYRAPHDLTLSLSAQNMFDRDPPFVARLLPIDANFDATNANPLGRFIALRVRKSW